MPTRMPAIKPTRPTSAFQVAAAQADDHTQRAAQEHQRADHDEGAQDEPQDRGGAAVALKLLGGDGRDESTQDDADDLRTEILDDRGTVQAEGARGIAQETGDTEAHVTRIAQGCQRHSCRANDQAREHNKPVLGEPFFHCKKSSFPLNRIT